MRKIRIDSKNKTSIDHPFFFPEKRVIGLVDRPRHWSLTGRLPGPGCLRANNTSLSVSVSQMNHQNRLAAEVLHQNLGHGTTLLQRRVDGVAFNGVLLLFCG